MKQLDRRLARLKGVADGSISLRRQELSKLALQDVTQLTDEELIDILGPDQAYFESLSDDELRAIAEGRPVAR